MLLHLKLLCFWLAQVDDPTSSGTPSAKMMKISSLSIDTDHDDEPTSSGAPPAKKLRISSLSIDGHDAIIGKLIVALWDMVQGRRQKIFGGVSKVV